jgi:rRNA maturation endonuclease Nob1
LDLIFKIYFILESCAKDAADMNINFDNYKILGTDKEKDKFEYQCTTCVKKFKFKRQLIDVRCFFIWKCN